MVQYLHINQLLLHFRDHKIGFRVPQAFIREFSSCSKSEAIWSEGIDIKHVEELNKEGSEFFRSFLIKRVELSNWN